MVANGVLVKNSQLSGGQEARDFQAVAQTDLDGVTAQVKATFAREMPHAFTLAPAEAVVPTHCRFKLTANHRVGAEARTLSVNASEACTGLAYNREQLTQRATALFSAHTAPGAQYHLIGEAQVQIIRVAPLTVSCRGLWAYSLSQDEEQFLAERIAGETPQQATKYLLETGFLARATVPDKLPQDPAHIHFQVFVGSQEQTVKANVHQLEHHMIEEVTAWHAWLPDTPINHMGAELAMQVLQEVEWSHIAKLIVVRS